MRKQKPQESNGVGITDISVVSVESVCLKDGEEWFRAHYLVVLSNKQRILSKTEKLHWINDDYSLMMEKVKAAIEGKVENMDIILHALSSEVFFSSDWPWKYLWLSMHHGVNKIIIDWMKMRDEKMRRADTLSANKRIKP